MMIDNKKDDQPVRLYSMNDLPEPNLVGCSFSVTADSVICRSRPKDYARQAVTSVRSTIHALHKPHAPT